MTAATVTVTENYFWYHDNLSYVTPTAHVFMWLRGGDEMWMNQQPQTTKQNCLSVCSRHKNTTEWNETNKNKIKNTIDNTQENKYKQVLQMSNKTMASNVNLRSTAAATTAGDTRNLDDQNANEMRHVHAVILAENHKKWHHKRHFHSLLKFACK